MQSQGMKIPAASLFISQVLCLRTKEYQLLTARPGQALLVFTLLRAKAGCWV